jgi:hypothetical protein
MTIYEKQQNSGDAWFRSSTGRKYSGSVALSAFADKYFNISSNIYQDIASNVITKLDVIQDVLILVTPSGYFIDKFVLVDDLPHPSNNYNNSREFSGNYSMDY